MAIFRFNRGASKTLGDARGKSSGQQLSAGSQRIVRQTRFSKTEINRAFAAARHRAGV